MKSKLIRPFVALAAVLVVGGGLGVQPVFGQAKTGSAPEISKQPENLVSEYGGNAMFKVVGKGNKLSYQWRKDGVSLADYANVGGAQGSTLRLVGVAQDDAGEYSVVLRNDFGAVTSSIVTLTVQSTVVFEDNFESGLSKWSRFGNDGELDVSADQNRSVGGNKSAKTTYAGQKMYRNLETEITGRMRATFWMYDDGNDKLRSFAELRGYTGKGYATYVAPGGIQQLIAVGVYSSDSALPSTGTLKTEVLDGGFYQGRVVAGKNSGWFNLNGSGAPERSVGWHKFEIERDRKGTTLSFYVDGILARTIADVEHVEIDSVTIGSIGKGEGANVAWFDDVKIEAYPKKFDWKKKDSKGKGLPDVMRMRETGEDATVTDVKEIKTVVELPGTAAKAVLGRWENDHAGVFAVDRRGVVEFTAKVTQSDAFRIEIEGREKNFKAPIVSLPLQVWINGENLGRHILPYTNSANGKVHVFTPYLPAGQHTIRIEWDNVESYCSLFLQAVRLQQLVAADANKNGFKDWVENRVLAQCGWDAPATNSRVSPAFIEGRAQYLSTMKLTAGGEKLAINQGPGHRWYANVPLTPGTAVPVEVSYQHGVLEESAEIKWEETNLLLGENATIRKGDALLLNAVPVGATNGTVRITIEGVTNYVTDASTPVAHRFAEAGTYTVAGLFATEGTSGSITVTVVDASFDGTLSAWVNRRRYWGGTNLPATVTLESDPRMKFVETEVAERQPKLKGRQFRIVIDEAEPRVVVARLGQNGPIITSTTVQGFRLYTPLDTYLKLTETNEDGSHTIDGGFVISPIMPQVKIDLQILVSGITFDDGTVSRLLQPGDFNNLGICTVRFVRAPGLKTSVCHAAKAYEDGVLIGWP